MTKKLKTLQLLTQGYALEHRLTGIRMKVTILNPCILTTIMLCQKYGVRRKPVFPQMMASYRMKKVEGKNLGMANEEAVKKILTTFQLLKMRQKLSLELAQPRSRM